MEQIHDGAIVKIPNNVTNDPIRDAQRKSTPQGPKKKKKSPMHVLRVALFMMRGGRSKKHVLSVDDESKSTWGKLVGSMRPLHLQSNQSKSQPPTSLPSPSPSDLISDGSERGYVSDCVVEEEPYSPYSPSPSSSRYASAVGLNELVQNDEESGKREAIVEESEEREDNGKDDGDEMIDSKAEEFIAQFYRQMRLQRMDSVDRRYIERNQRSLGC